MPYYGTDLLDDGGRAAAVALARELTYDCTCGVPGGFCRVCGEITPAVSDPEVVAAFGEASAPRRTARRVIRKELPS